MYPPGFADLFSVKEDGEILNSKKAAFLASKVMQAWVVEKLEDIIDKNKKVKHSKLSGECGLLVARGGRGGRGRSGPGAAHFCTTIYASGRFYTTITLTQVRVHSRHFACKPTK